MIPRLPDPPGTPGLSGSSKHLVHQKQLEHHKYQKHLKHQDYLVLHLELWEHLVQWEHPKNQNRHEYLIYLKSQEYNFNSLHHLHQPNLLPSQIDVMYYHYFTILASIQFEQSKSFSKNV